jgi:hypothetical protein
MEDVTPFPRCPALDGYHCQSNSLAKIYHFHSCPLSEDMIFGLGAGMGFIYWHMKGNPETNIPEYVFIGGRGNTKHFFEDLGKRTGVKITEMATSSEKKAEEALLATLRKQEPIMVYGDMGLLPWFDLPDDYHFGGHTFVVCGFDGKDKILISDMDQKASGLKKGFYYTVTLEQLRKARGSTFKPFPPKNTYLKFDFRTYQPPTKNDIYDAIRQTVDSMMNPPISNIGVRGIRRTAKEIQKWPQRYSDFELRMNLFTLYVFIEIGGTGGGCFRYMYARFLQEAADITENDHLHKAATMIDDSGKLFTEVGLLFKDAETAKDVQGKIEKADALFYQIAEKEEEAYTFLSNVV